MIGIAVAGQVQGRPWVADGDLGGVKVVTLFPDAMYHELPAQEVKIAMKRALDELAAGCCGCIRLRDDGLASGSAVVLG